MLSNGYVSFFMVLSYKILFGIGTSGFFKEKS